MSDADRDLRWNPNGWAEDADGEPEQGRWEYWADDELTLWRSESDRQAFQQQRQAGAPVIAVCSAHHNGRRYQQTRPTQRGCALRSVRRQTERSANPTRPPLPTSGQMVATPPERRPPLPHGRPRPTRTDQTSNDHHDHGHPGHAPKDHQ